MISLVAWDNEYVNDLYVFRTKTDNELVGLDIETEVYGWLAQCGYRQAIKTLRLIRVYRSTSVRDRFKQVYRSFRNSKPWYEVEVAFEDAAEAVAFKLLLATN